MYRQGLRIFERGDKIVPFTKIVLSPCFFELMTNQETEIVEMEHLLHMQSILDYLMPLNVEFDLYEEAPYFPDAAKRPPISRYHYHNISCIQVYAKIQRKICYDRFVSLKEYSASSIDSEYDYPENSETKDSFLKYMSYLLLNRRKLLLFIGIPNRNKPRPYLFAPPDSLSVEITPISDPETDCSQQLAEVFPREEDKNLFPNAHMCIALNKEFLNQRAMEDRMSLIKKIGSEVATRNGYYYNRQLSSLNSQKQQSVRHIYSRAGTYITFLSLDFESGGFEVFNHLGEHLGQYSFTGERVKSPSPLTHKLFF